MNERKEPERREAFWKQCKSCIYNRVYYFPCNCSPLYKETSCSSYVKRVPSKALGSHSGNKKENK